MAYHMAPEAAASIWVISACAHSTVALTVACLSSLLDCEVLEDRDLGLQVTMQHLGSAWSSETAKDGELFF